MLRKNTETQVPENSLEPNKSVFVVIDMQHHFIAARKKHLITSLKKSLIDAMQEGAYILFVNYIVPSSYGDGRKVPTQKIKDANPLIPDLERVVEKYPNKDILWKEDDSGAKIILDYLKSKNILFSKICVSGVNSCACVSCTVKDLSKESMDNFLIELDRSNCACDCAYNDENCTKITLKNLQKYRNVIIKKPKSALEMSEEAKIGNDLNKKACALINKQGVKQYGSSMKIQILLGKSTFIETFTPDPDGYVRDMNHNVAAPGTSIMNIQVESIDQEAKDVQAAIDDPENNYKVIATIRMR